MKIISKFKDYYDGGAVYGIDQERIYIRESKLVYDDDVSGVGFNIIGFCGKLYPFVSRLPFYPDDNSDYNPKDLTLFGDDILEYEFEEIENNTPYISETKYKKVKRNYNDRRRYYQIDSREKLAENIKQASNNKKLLNIFLKYKTPIFWYGLIENIIV